MLLKYKRLSELQISITMTWSECETVWTRQESTAMRQFSQTVKNEINVTHAYNKLSENQ